MKQCRDEVNVHFNKERPTSELAGLPPVGETIVVPNTLDEKLAGGNSGPTICSVAPLGKCFSVEVFGVVHAVTIEKGDDLRPSFP
jgi:hypothetical protein